MSSESTDRPGKKSRFITRDPNKKKKNLFVREAVILTTASDIANNDKLSAEERAEKFKEFCGSYEDLLDQCKLITKVSDRLQNKINTSNSKLAEKNDELQSTIDALTKAKVGRRATTYVLIIAVVLFLMTEAWLEPWMEDKLHNAIDPESETVSNIEWYTGLGLKGILVLLLKPIEMIVERTLMKRAQREAQKAKSSESKSDPSSQPIPA